MTFGARTQSHDSPWPNLTIVETALAGPAESWPQRLTVEKESKGTSRKVHNQTPLICQANLTKQAALTITAVMCVHAAIADVKDAGACYSQAAAADTIKEQFQSSARVSTNRQRFVFTPSLQGASKTARGCQVRNGPVPVRR